MTFYVTIICSTDATVHSKYDHTAILKFIGSLIPFIGTLKIPITVKSVRGYFSYEPLNLFLFFEGNSIADC